VSLDTVVAGAWLTVAEQIACVDAGWHARVLARLTWAQDVHGDRWTTMTVGELLAELRSEAEDLGGWGVLVVQLLELEAHDVDDATRWRVDELVQEIAALGAQADELVGQALGVLAGP